jgi:hypothetical protein
LVLYHSFVIFVSQFVSFKNIIWILIFDPMKHSLPLSRYSPPKALALPPSFN